LEFPVLKLTKLRLYFHFPFSLKILSEIEVDKKQFLNLSVCVCVTREIVENNKLKNYRIKKISFYSLQKKVD